MVIETKQKPFDDLHDSFVITGTIREHNYRQDVVAVIKAEGKNKSQAVERVLESIDSLVEWLNDSKKRIANI